MTDETETRTFTEEIEVPKIEEEPEDYEDNEIGEAEEEDHPYMAIVDIAVRRSAIYCKDKEIPEPDLSIWEDLGRGCLNEALWHYCPESLKPDTPILNLLFGVGCMALCFSPPILHLIRERLDNISELEEGEELEDEEEQ